VKLPPRLRSIKWKRIGLIFLGLFVLGVAGFAGTVVATENNQFCVSCHELDYAYKGGNNPPTSITPKASSPTVWTATFHRSFWT
jgi:nitrate/TMAO reductase-like tetraheme cytochrome c subunit